jgi:hypothetical protein
LAPGTFVPRVIRIVLWGIVVARVAQRAGRYALLELLDLELLHGSPLLGVVVVDSSLLAGT